MSGPVYVTTEPCTLARFEADCLDNGLVRQIGIQPGDDRVFLTSVGDHSYSFCDPREIRCSDGETHVLVTNFADQTPTFETPGGILLHCDYTKKYGDLTQSPVTGANRTVLEQLIADHLGKTVEEAKDLAGMALACSDDDFEMTPENTTLYVIPDAICVMIDGGERATISLPRAPSQVVAFTPKPKAEVVRHAAQWPKIGKAKKRAGRR